MAAPSSSSDSEDEEENRRLREASIGFTIALEGGQNAALQDKSSRAQCVDSSTNKKRLAHQRPSSRFDVNEKEEGFLLDGITPEFQNFVSKKLTKHLDSLYEDDLRIVHRTKDSISSDEVQKSLGIRLFTTSVAFCGNARESVEEKPKRPPAKSSESDDEQSKLLEAAVTPESIFHFSATGQYWQGPAVTECKGSNKKRKKKKKHEKSELDVNETLSQNEEVSTAVVASSTLTRGEETGSENARSDNGKVKKRHKKRKKAEKDIDTFD